MYSSRVTFPVMKTLERSSLTICHVSFSVNFQMDHVKFRNPFCLLFEAFASCVHVKLLNLRLLHIDEILGNTAKFVQVGFRQPLASCRTLTNSGQKTTSAPTQSNHFIVYLIQSAHSNGIYLKGSF